MDTKYDNVMVIGTGRTAFRCVEVLHRYHDKVSLLVEEREEYASAALMCKKIGIDIKEFEKGGVIHFLSEMNEKTLVISAHNGLLIPKCVIERENLTVINMHIALLPKYRGMNAPTWEIYNMEEYGGVTWHKITPEIDKGGILIQKKFPIGEDDIAIGVLIKSFDLGVEALGENVSSILNDEITEFYPKGEYRLYLKNELPNSGYLDETWSIRKKYAFLRSMDYRGTRIMPKPRMYKDGKEFEIWKYNRSSTPKESSGYIICEEDNEMCLNYWIREVKLFENYEESRYTCESNVSM